MKTLVNVILIMILITSLSSDEATILDAIVSDFQVNENSAISDAPQESCSISSDGSENFIITWCDWRNGAGDIYAQRLTIDGTAKGSNFKVNDDTGSVWQTGPSISANNSGIFIISWDDERNGEYDIYAQRYSSDGTALGSNFRVNDDQGDAWQWFSSISIDNSGNFIIAWQDGRNGDDDIYAQRYASDGTKIGNNFKVNDDLAGARQGAPYTAAYDSGNFIISWSDSRNGESNPDIYAQRYSSDGTVLGSNFKVNDDSGSMWQFDPSLTVDDSGKFNISWQDYRNGETNPDIYAQRYSSDGTALGTNFKVNDDQGSNEQRYTSITAASMGNYVIAWVDKRNGDWDIYTQQYASDGNELGSNFQVNDEEGSASRNWNPSISLDHSGNIIITWVDRRNDGIGDIYFQRFSSDGTILGNNSQVNDDLLGTDQYYPSISVDRSDNFVLTWMDYRNGAFNPDIYAQRCSIDGTALGSNFKVNDDQGSAMQYYPFISADDNGNFIILWEDERNGKWDIYAQRYSNDGTGLGSNFKVNDDPGSDNQIYPSIAVDKSGNFIIVRIDNRNGNDDIYAQQYSSDGTAVGSYFKVNDDIGSAGQESPSISAYSNGSFIITFTDSRNGDITDIYAQRYSSDGTALGSNFKVNDDAGIAWQVYPVVSADSSGNFNIIWIDKREGDYYIYAQRYSSGGTALGSNFKVDVYLSNPWHSDHSISTDSNGNFIVIWKDEQDSDLDTFAQRFLKDGTALGNIFRLTNTSEREQSYPDVKLWNGRIYNAWMDYRVGNTGCDIWANVLDWDDPWGTSVDDQYQIPSAFVLHQNYPNPFNPSTTIKFTLPKFEFVTLKIYNVLGEKIATIVNNKLQAGIHTYQFDGSNLASGVYLYRIEAGEFSDVKKMVILH